MIEKEFRNSEQTHKQVLRGTFDELCTFTIDRILSSGELPYFISIAGNSASGKSTVSKALAGVLSSYHSVGVIDLDAFLNDKGKEKYTEKDPDWPPIFFCGYDPALFNLDQVQENIMRLKSGYSILLPHYDRSLQRKCGEEEIKGDKHIYIVEGMRALDDEVSTSTDLHVLVDARFTTRLIRRILRNTLEFGRKDINELIQRYVLVTEPGYRYYEQYLQQKSDFVLPNEDNPYKMTVNDQLLVIYKDDKNLLTIPISQETQAVLASTNLFKV